MPDAGGPPSLPTKVLPRDLSCSSPGHGQSGCSPLSTQKHYKHHMPRTYALQLALKSSSSKFKHYFARSSLGRSPPADHALHAPRGGPTGAGTQPGPALRGQGAHRRHQPFWARLLGAMEGGHVRCRGAAVSAPWWVAAVWHGQTLPTVHRQACSAGTARPSLSCGHVNLYAQHPACARLGASCVLPCQVDFLVQCSQQPHVALLPAGTFVYKAFNTIGVEHMVSATPHISSGTLLHTGEEMRAGSRVSS